MEQPSDVQVSLLLANIGFFDSQVPMALAEHLQRLLSISAQSLRSDCGIALRQNNLQDDHLVAMYAAWLYSRGRSGDLKPPMLQLAIRNRQISQAREGTP